MNKHNPGRRLAPWLGAGLALAALLALAWLPVAPPVGARVAGGLAAAVAPPASGTATFTVTNTNDSGVGSLRQAILSANGAAGLDTIAFAIPGAGVHTITPLSPLPTISDAAVVDGTTQGCGSGPCIELNGTSAGGATNGLTITAGGSTVRGLIINRFGGDGIVMQTAGGNILTGNYIGTNAGGSAAAANGNAGVLITSGGNTVGGTDAGARNLLSGNNGTGVELSGNSAAGNIVEGNYIGTNVAGTAAIPNVNATGSAGVLILGGAGSNIVGGSAAGAGNVIAGHMASPQSGCGVCIISGPGSNVVWGNYIGTNAAGTGRLGNLVGVYVEHSTGNAVGGSTAGEGNLISGNSGTGVFFEGSDSNVIQGNYIGTDHTGNLSLANYGGVTIDNGNDNVVGDSTAGGRNIISGNNAQSDADGLDITGSATGNLVEGNYIGTNAAGTVALPNADAGIYVGAPSGVITGNVISGNGGQGVAIAGAGAGGNVLQGNAIGTRADGSAAVPNGAEGVRISGAPGNIIGGSGANAGNRIAFNLGAGVAISGTTAISNAILSNAIYANTALGIDLGLDGVTPNQACGGRSGPNHLENYPLLTGAAVSGGNLVVTGTLNSEPNATFTVQFFANPACDPSGHGEGQAFLGAAQVTTAANCSGAFVVTLPGGASGSFITASATDARGDTSEFSACIPVSGPAATPTAVLPTPTPPPPGPTPTPCGRFSDVHPADYFYTPVQYLVGHGVISGYGDCTFRPYNNTTRSQMVKIVVLGFQKPIQTPAAGAYTFADVPPSHPFFAVVETAAGLHIVSGYTCGQAPAGPCVPPQNRPYFLPYAPVTRGQLSKIDVVAAGWPLQNPPTPTFLDVLPGSAFYPFVETAVCRGAISGYADHTFRPANPATRGQIAKIVYLSITGAAACGPTRPLP